MATDRKSSNKQPNPPPKFTAHFAETEAPTRVFSTTWVIATAALVVLVAAAWLFLRPSRDSDDALGSASEEVDQIADQVAPTGPTKPARELVPENPLDISKLALDARSRARTWQRDAELSELVLDVVGGQPLALRFVYGVPRGTFTPGGVLAPQLYELEFATPSAQVRTRETAATTPAYAAADPNCPLDAAFRAARQAGFAEAGSVQARYGYSSKHSREIWTFGSGAKKPLLVDANNCAILVR